MLYFDNNATTPLAEEVMECIRESMAHLWANPSSNYIEGKDSKHAMESSRQSIAHMINANNSHEIVFTSGGTEVFIKLMSKSFEIIFNSNIYFSIKRQIIG